MSNAIDAPITQLLARWRDGDRAALERLTPLVYADLQRVAQRHLRREGAITLTPTDLVNEACLKLLGPSVDWQDRAHFFAVASRQMRHVLVDHARHKLREKRGGGVHPVTLITDISDEGAGNPELLALDEALDQLGAFDARKRDMLELHYFGGMSYAEMALTLSVSEATVDRDLRFAKAWIRQALTA
jgi:RNA polymerase sigma factor (TIGR02999 family)